MFKEGQKKSHSLLEATLNTVVGFGISFVANILVLPMFGFKVTIADSLEIGLIFTVISIVRSYCLRRLFNYFHIRKPDANLYRSYMAGEDCITGDAVKLASDGKIYRMRGNYEY